MEKTSTINRQLIDGLSALDFMYHEAVAERFKYLSANAKHEDPLGFYDQQALFINRIVSDSTDLQRCTTFSLYAAFIDVALDGLSLDPNQKLTYLEVRNVNLAKKDAPPQWQARASRKISPYGELVLRIEAGQLKYADKPVIVYEGDTFRIGLDDNGRKWVKWESVIPRKSKTIIGSFIRLERTDGTHDFSYLLQEDIARLAAYSQNSNRRTNKANELYSSVNGQIDPGFLGAKTIKHAFQTLPKLKMKGTSSEIEDDGDETKTVFTVEDEDTNSQPPSTPPSSTGAKNQGPLSGLPPIEDF